MGLVRYVYSKLFKINLYKVGFTLSMTIKIMTSKHDKVKLFDESCFDKNLKLIKEGDLFFYRQSLKDNQPRENNKFP